MAADTLERRALGAPLDTGDTAVPASGVAEVYEANFRYVWRCLRSLGVHDAALDDAVQDVFVVVQRKLERFDGRADLRTWLYAITLRVARRYRARAAKDAQKFVPGEGGLGADADDAALPRGATEPAGDLERELLRSEQLDLARRALSCLDESKREVLVLASIEQMSAPEIAQITGLPLNTVYSRLRAARAAFSAQIARLTPAFRRSLP